MPLYLHVCMPTPQKPIVTVLDEFRAASKEDVYDYIRLGLRPEITFRFVTMGGLGLPMYLIENLDEDARERIYENEETKDDVRRVVDLTAHLTAAELAVEMTTNSRAVLIPSTSELFDLFYPECLIYSDDRLTVNLLN